MIRNGWARGLPAERPPHVDALPLGQRVAYWRHWRLLSQTGLATILGRSKSWVDKVERGARRVDRVPDVVAVAHALRVPPLWLIHGDLTTTPSIGDPR